MRRRILDRRRPTCYPAAPATNSPGRRVILSTGRGDVRISAVEAVALGLELFAVAAGLQPEAAANAPRLTLALAERCATLSELSKACTQRAERKPA